MKTDTIKSEYDAQAESFLERNGLTLDISPANPAKPAPRGGGGRHYKVTIKRNSGGRGLVFDFWGSIHDAETHKRPKAYDVLACISGDSHCPDTFEDFCGDYGMDTDSRKAEWTWRKCVELANKLHNFFSETELSELSEIQ